MSAAQVVEPRNLDSVSANNLRHEILDLVNQGVKTILVNLDRVTFMNSSWMGALIATPKAVKAKGGELALCSLSDRVKIIFELSRMERIFKIYSDRQEFEAKHNMKIK